MQNFGRFYTIFDVDREYLRNEYIQNRKDMWSRTIHPTFGETSPVTFGLLTSRTCEFAPTQSHFSGDYISALEGACQPLNFLYTLEIQQGLLAHTTNGAGIPQDLRANI